MDLQAREDRVKLEEAELFLEEYRGHTVCLDEIQLLPDFFQCFEARDRPGSTSSRGFSELVRDLAPESATLVAPVGESYHVNKQLRVTTLGEACTG
jgi:hypothetical protein